MIMYGLKNESLIFRLKQPETTIGRHTSNHIVIPKSLKVSRYHAVISFLGGAPLIKDISEWGVYLNNSLLCKHRWAELKLGDAIALGALNRDDGGRILEVVAWESEDTKSYTAGTVEQKLHMDIKSNLPDTDEQKKHKDTESNSDSIDEQKQVEVIDISDGEGDGDGDGVYVIDICSDDETTQDESYQSSQADHVTKEVTKATLEIALLSDGEDDVFEPPVSPRKPEEPIQSSPCKPKNPIERIQPSLYKPKEPIKPIQPPPCKPKEPIKPIQPSPCKPKEPIFKPLTNTEIFAPPTSEMDVCSDENQIITPIESPTSVEVTAPSTLEMEISPIENEVVTAKIPEISDEIPSVVQTESKFVDVTPSMNGLLKESKLSDYPKAFQNIMDYSSDEDNYSSYDDLNSSVNEDVKCNQKDVKLCLSEKLVEDIKITPKPASRISKTVKHEPKPLVDKYFEELVPSKWTTSTPIKAKSEDEQIEWLEPKRDSESTDTDYQSPLEIFSKFHDENDDNDGYSSEDSSNAALENNTITPIIHRTLLTNKIAKIAVIAPLPNKQVARRRKRKWESPERPAADVERDLRSSESAPSTSVPQSKNSPEKKSHRSSPSAAPREKKSLRAVRESTKEAREKIRAMYPLPPTRIQRTAATRPKPKVKVTDRNRGDFLTRMEPVTCHRSPAKPVESKNTEGSPKKPAPAAKPVEPETRVESPTEPTMVTPPRPEPEASRTEHRRSIDEILDEIDMNAVGGVENKSKETVPSVKTTDRTIEVCVSFAKAAPLKTSGSNCGIKLIGESILKKSTNEGASFTEKKRVSFPKKIVTGVSNEEDHSRYSFSTMMCKIWPQAECNNCGASDHSTKRCTKDPVCYNCLRTGHIAVSCSRPMMCFNCKGDGHKGSECPLPDIRLNPDSKPIDRSFQSPNHNDENAKRRRIRDPRLRALHQKSDESV